VREVVFADLNSPNKKSKLLSGVEEYVPLRVPHGDGAVQLGDLDAFPALAKARLAPDCRLGLGGSSRAHMTPLSFEAAVSLDAAVEVSEAVMQAASRHSEYLI
jgi:hypothetical protein